MTNYRERLTVPPVWWLILGGFAGSVWLTYHHAYGARVSVPAGLGVLLLGAVALLAYGTLTVAVDDTALTVGKARLPLSALGTIEARTGNGARLARGPELDPRAYTAFRGYLPAVVRVEVTDPADPTPYWLFSTRRPERLVAVLGAAHQHAGTSPGRSRGATGDE